MKKLIIISSIITLISCENKHTSAATSALVSDDNIADAIMYEANIRQYSEEGTFEAFRQDIPKLKELGVKILWLMPIYPISSTKSKGSLGSYYAITDYTKINPEFGTIEDFRRLVNTAHQNDMFVILDWVANHTGWDHVWLKDHPDYYTQNAAGEVIDPINPETGESWGWTDVADLNYDNMEMREKMKDAMKYWIEEENIDGFRCDVAAGVPVDFWEQSFAELRSIKPLLNLAEAWEPELMHKAFDMAYGWGTHHVMNHIAQGKDDVEAWDLRMKEIENLYQEDDFLLNFTSNHDENSWSGTVFERMGDAAEVFAVLSYAAPGMPLIYSGQEYDLNKRLLFFEKDLIEKNKGKFYDLYVKLGQFKRNNPALHVGQFPAKYDRINTSDQQSILAFKRAKDDREVVFIANLTNETQTVQVSVSGTYTNVMTNEKITLSEDQPHVFEAWEYLLLDQQK